MLRFDDWTRALRLALGLNQPGRGRLVVLDEFPYLLIAAALGREARSLWHPLDVLRAVGLSVDPRTSSSSAGRSTRWPIRSSGSAC
jgi:hypothetical protein